MCLGVCRAIIQTWIVCSGMRRAILWQIQILRLPVDSVPGYPLNRFRYSDNVPGYVPDYHSSHQKRQGNLNLPNWLVSHLRIHASQCECEREHKKTWAPMGLLKHQDVLWLTVRAKFYSSVLASGVSQLFLLRASLWRFCRCVSWVFLRFFNIASGLASEFNVGLSPESFQHFLLPA